MFTEITLIDYARPLVKRLASRKVCGPYKWRPTQRPGKGRGFYQSGRGLACDPRGSTFDLRLEEANNHLADSRLRFVDGYYIDSFQDDTLQPIIARLPHGRGFLAGWTMGAGMIACLDLDIWEDEAGAAREAHRMAEQDAEKERNYREENDDDASDD